MFPVCFFSFNRKLFCPCLLLPEPYRRCGQTSGSRNPFNHDEIKEMCFSIFIYFFFTRTACLMACLSVQKNAYGNLHIKQFTYHIIYIDSLHKYFSFEKKKPTWTVWRLERYHVPAKIFGVVHS